MEPIGEFSSVYKLKYGTPRQGDVNGLSRGSLKLRNDIPASSLDGLHEYGHVWIIFVFNHNANKLTRPKIRPPRLKGKKVGLFASRTPHRYNPLGLSCVKLDSVDYENGTVWMSGVDLVEGTIILDIKPYHPADAMQTAQITVPPWMQEAAEHPLDVCWQPAAEASLQAVVPQLQFYPSFEEAKAACASCLSCDPRPAYIRKRNAHSEVYGFRYDNLNVLYHTHAALGSLEEGQEATGAVIVAVEYVADDEEATSDQEVKKGGADGSKEETDGNSKSTSLGTRTGAVEVGDGASHGGSCSFQKEQAKTKRHLAKQARKGKQAPPAADSPQAIEVSEADLAVAARVVEAFTVGSGDANKFPLGSPLHKAHKTFRNSCLRWIKPGSLPNRKEFATLKLEAAGTTPTASQQQQQQLSGSTGLSALLAAAAAGAAGALVLASLLQRGRK